jgi:hypothetical protein
LSGSEKLDIARQKLCCQRVRVGDIEVGIPAGDTFFDVSCVVQHWIDTDGLKHDHRGATSDNAKENSIRLGPFKRDFEPEMVTIKRQRGGDMIHNEERRNAGDFWCSSHVSFHGRFEACTTPVSLAPAVRGRRNTVRGHDTGEYSLKLP